MTSANTAHGKAGATHGRFQEFLATPLQVSQALLMPGSRESVVHAPAVVHKRARPIEPQQLFGWLVAPRRDRPHNTSHAG